MSKNEHSRRRKDRRGSGSVTLHDVAKIAGVSAITASRVLNSPQLVSPEAQARVQDAVLRTGYVPNLLAGGLASNRSRLVATIVPSVHSPMFASTVESISTTLAGMGYEVMVGLSGYVDSREDQLLQEILSRRPAGIILTGVVHSVESRRRLLTAKIPVVETWDLTPAPIGLVVGFSHEKVGREIAQYLVSRGVRRPAVITADDQRATQRTHGFTECAQALGLPLVPVVKVGAPTTVGSARKALGELLKRHRDLDAVACSSDVLAMGILQEAKARGIDVPKQLKVTGFGDLSYAADLEPALTTVAIDGAAIGKEAARFIVNHHAGKAVTERVLDVGFSITRRESA
jgi:LacI family gluconate utilization system Gnt-I transcriptional repressor